jgi:GMP synthase (glutamine-hydrolysing)
MTGGNKPPRSTAHRQPSKSNQVAILDAGAQYGKVIDRRIRNLLVKSDILPIDTPWTKLLKYGAIVISGGPDDVFAVNSPKPDIEIFNGHIPVLGICYGMQLMNQIAGGKVEQGKIREDGQFEIIIDPKSAIFDGLNKNQKVLLTHGNSVTKVAADFKIIGKSGKIIAAIGNEKKRIYGLQFHPEVDLTENGKQILSNFLFRVSRLKPTYHLEDKIAQSIEYIIKGAGKNDVLLLASGGVDSTVCAVLLAKALSAQKIRVAHIDTGFMRLNESKAVKRALKKAGINMVVIDATNQFLNASTIIDNKRSDPLKKVTDPEVKRRIIGDTFVSVMDSIIDQLKLDPKKTMLVQGTLRPDLIESASKLASSKATVIKTHHNDSGLVRKLREEGKVIEPLQHLHKDEVRQIGKSLGLPPSLIRRQPFPGPGLAIRLICSNKPKVDNDFLSISRSLTKFADKNISVNLLPIRTVGVQGDGRSYGYVAALSGESNWEELFNKAQQIPRRIHGVNRVVYVFGASLKSPTTDITPTYPTTDAINQLRMADAKVNKVLKKYGLDRSLSQVPVISFPVNFGKKGHRSIAIRTFITNDFMTGLPAIPGIDISEKALNEIVESVLQVPGISRVAYDLTSKPPATTEWE